MCQIVLLRVVRVISPTVSSSISGSLRILEDEEIDVVEGEEGLETRGGTSLREEREREEKRLVVSSLIDLLQAYNKEKAGENGTHSDAEEAICHLG